MSQKNHINADNPPGEDGLTKRHAFGIATMMMISIITFAVAIILIIFAVMKYGFISDGPLEAEQIFEVESGKSLAAIAEKLEKEGIIHSADRFKLFVKIDGGATKLKAGEYAIPPKASGEDVYKIITDGQAILRPITFAEGLTSAQIIRQINASDFISGENAKIPPEGTLLPETYLLPKSMSKTELVKKMRNEQEKLLDELWPNRDVDLPFQTKQEAIILASIVEKETGIGSERDHVAGVFINRLRKGMRLESDPTIIYGITKGEPLGRGIRRSEIKRKTDWNTYQIFGLPKTPICNPGRAAIKAVLNPKQTDDLFFVADGTGGHVFAKTLKEHNANVRRWRKIEKERKKASKNGAK